MKEVEDFLLRNTFHCNILQALITRDQCRANCLRATWQYGCMLMYGNRNEELESELAAEGLWSKESDNGVIKCMACSEYIPPTREQLEKHMATKRVRRYPDSEAGKVERKLMSYIYLYQERLNEEEYRYLSGASPISSDVSYVHD